MPNQHHPKLTTWLLRPIRIAALLLLAGSLSACAPATPQPGSTPLNILIAVDGKQQALQVAPGTTVTAALTQAGITLNALDRVDPPGFTVLSQPAPIRIVRVKEEFEVKDVVIPFEQQIVRNESLPEGKEMLVQSGSNGLRQDTYRRLFEDSIEVSSTIFKKVTITEARPEIVMVGVQAPYTSAALPGRLAYLSSGNAWTMEKTTGERRAILTTGDLDGHVFTLSPDGKWLLYTRKGPQDDPNIINTLWMVDVTKEEPATVNLKVSNIVHYAGWVPGAGLTVAYSTVEPRSAPPGWQANNDLQMVKFAASGAVVSKKEIIKTNAGGIYGWWGASFAWSPDGSKLAYMRPDSAGLVNLETGEMKSLLEIFPLQTHSDWAWVPGLSWSPDKRILYTVNHAVTAGMASPEESRQFDLSAVPVSDGAPIMLSQNTGMFAYPAASPLVEGGRFRVAYLEAVNPQQSETSAYRLVIMDQDGSNREVVYPRETASSLSPQNVVWSPPGYENKESWLAFIDQGNLYFLNPTTKKTQQVTGDGSISRIDWK